MISEFENLRDSEVELMLRAPILVCILIAGADGTIDKREINKAIDIAGKQQASGSSLGRYFAHVYEDFEDKIMVLIQGFSPEPAQRAVEVVGELSLLNNVFPKIDKGFVGEFYAMLRDLARKVALSSGGLLGINAVAPEEAKYLDLAMIDPPA